MKRIPAIVTLLAVILLMACFYQARGRGLGFVPPVTEWEAHPAWWHFPILADIGEELVVSPAIFFVALPAAKLLGISVPLVWASIGLVIASEAALVFCVFHLLWRLIRKGPNQSPEPTAFGRGSS